MDFVAVGSENTIAHFIAGQRKKGHVPNKLIGEKSPYLLQHAFNPVQWHPWGEEAFELARKENRPIFLSIGYSTCHWCHVMEQESFENPELAGILNNYFIAVKVDREERPDLDQVYMAVTQAMTGSGGWPMSVFLTPDLLPFYAGTYFPPMGKYGRPGFAELLESVHRAWQTDRQAIVAKAGSVVQQLAELEKPAPGKRLVGDGLAAEAARQLKIRYDQENGGFGSAPKFPRPVVLNFLFRYGHKNNEQDLIEMALRTLREMGRGGMYDHLGGGFHRYSVDQYWRVPHFEKMLYDQALLAVSCLEAYQLSGESCFATTASETLDFVLREMTSPEGAFFSALDADSPRPEKPSVKSEGAFYLWSQQEIQELLAPLEASVCLYFFGIEPQGNTINDPHGDFGDKNVLYAAHSLAQTAQKFALPAETVNEVVRGARAKLLRKRNQRPFPHLDDKVLASWNGLMISALAKGAFVLGNERYLEAAGKAAQFLKKMMLVPGSGRIFHRYRDGEVGIDGQLDDYAFVVQGFIDLYEATFDRQWLALAKEMVETQITRFADTEAGAFFESATGDSSIILRLKADYDGAEPAGNSITALNFLRLGHLVDHAYAKHGKETIEAFGAVMHQGPTAMPQMLAALDFVESDLVQIVIAGTEDGVGTRELQKTIARHFLPSRVLLWAGGPEDGGVVDEQPGLAGAMAPLAGKATAYVCKAPVCLPPTNDPVELDKILRSLL